MNADRRAGSAVSATALAPSETPEVCRPQDPHEWPDELRDWAIREGYLCAS